MEKTLGQLKEDKSKLEGQIKDLLANFEKEYGVKIIKSMSLIRICEAHTPDTISNIDIALKL